jgi:hypothetical protein
MVVAEMTRCETEARERVHFPRLHRWFPGSGDERPERWKILSAHLVLRKNSQEVSGKCEKGSSFRVCQRKSLHRGRAVRSSGVNG